MKNGGRTTQEDNDFATIIALAWFTSLPIVLFVLIMENIIDNEDKIINIVIYLKNKLINLLLFPYRFIDGKFAKLFGTERNDDK